MARARKSTSGPSPLPDSLDPLEMAFDADGADPSPDSPARVLLQRHVELTGEDLRHRRLQIASERMGMLLKGLTAFAGLAVAGLLGWMVWNAAHDRSLVITAFHSPPEMGARGLSGDVLAAQVMDRLGAIDADATSFRAAKTFQGDWGGDIKVEIPETGVSISELDRYLRSLLSHRTTIGGEVFRRPDGQITVNVRTGSIASHSFTGPEADLDKLLQSAAEMVFKDTQPFRYSKYLEKKGRIDEAMAVVRELADTGPASEKPWAWAQISNLLELSDMRGAADAGRMSVHLDPNQGLGYLNWSIAETFLGHDEVAYQNQKRSSEILQRGGGGLSDTGIKIGASNVGGVLYLEGDFLRALEASRLSAAKDVSYMSVSALQPNNVAYALLGLHEVTAARATPGVLSDAANAAIILLTNGDTAVEYASAAELQDWPRAEQLARDSLAVIDAKHDYPSLQAARIWVRPRLALALAHQGRFAEAQATIADAPADCYHCQVTRGQIAALAGDRAAALRYFAEAARQGPSLPQAQLAWANALLSFGDPDGALRLLIPAIAKFPRYADLRELAGEAQLAKGDAQAAAAQFRAADPLAPRWGRNHLMWGQTLMRQGKTADARAQWLSARGMDLTPIDRAIVDRLLAGGR
jgi:tetratricopeptide (TPR) repeat protein